MNKDIKQVMGYCIICGKNIPQDINKPFCKTCSISYQKVVTTSRINGYYCHYCEDEKSGINNYKPLCIECRPLDRHDNSINDYYIEKVNEIRNISLTERQKIKPLWLCNEIEIRNSNKHNVILKEIRITKILGIIKLTSVLNTTDIFENEPKNNRRIMSILRAWKHGIGIMPPTINYEDSISFLDGRHRTLAAYFLGAKTIPVYCKYKR